MIFRHTAQLLLRSSRIFRDTQSLASINSAQFAPITRFISISPKFNMSSPAPENPTSVYDFQVKDTYGKDVSLDKYKGKVLVIVNIASQCGLTSSNYEQLTELHNKYKDQDVQVLSFPCNQFASEMPEADGEEMVCHLKKANADVGDVFKKVNVNGDDAAPLYKFLKKQKGGFLGGILGDNLKWNFTKFLVDRNGKPVERYAPTTSPNSIHKKIDELLAQKTEL